MKRRKEKRRSGKKGYFLAALIAILLYFFPNLGFGPGGEGGSSDNKEDSVEESYDESMIIKITIDENNYIYNNSSVSLEELENELLDIHGNYIVEINDQNASENAYQGLISVLEDRSIRYIEK